MNARMIAALTILASALTAGCGRPASASADRIQTPPAAAYHAGRGLKLTPRGAEFVGLAMAEFTGRVPADALLRTVEGTFVYVENGGWLLRTPVKLEPRAATADAVGAVEGLYEGDRIVTQGVRALWLAELHFLRAGQACAHEG